MRRVEERPQCSPPHRHEGRVLPPIGMKDQCVHWSGPVFCSSVQTVSAMARFASEARARRKPVCGYQKALPTTIPPWMHELDTVFRLAPFGWRGWWPRSMGWLLMSYRASCTALPPAPRCGLHTARALVPRLSECPGVGSETSSAAGSSSVPVLGRAGLQTHKSDSMRRG